MLGAFLNIDPRIFERLLNLERKFTNGIDGVSVLDYVQAYSSASHLAEHVARMLEAHPAFTRPWVGNVRKWWLDVAGQEQRVVVAQIPAQVDFVNLPTGEQLILHALIQRL